MKIEKSNIAKNMVWDIKWAYFGCIMPSYEKDDGER